MTAEPEMHPRAADASGEALNRVLGSISLSRPAPESDACGCHDCPPRWGCECDCHTAGHTMTDLDALLKLGPPVRGSSVPQCRCARSELCACERYAHRLEQSHNTLQLENILLNLVAEAGFPLLRALDQRNRVAGLPEGHDDTPLLSAFRAALEAWELSR